VTDKKGVLMATQTGPTLDKHDWGYLIEALDRMRRIEDRLDMLERHLAGLCGPDCRCKLPT
jgi:hypothetical protein